MTYSTTPCTGSHDWYRRFIDTSGCCWECANCPVDQWVPRAADGSFPPPKTVHHQGGIQ